MPKRIKRERTKGWRKPKGSVCVTRPGYFGNYTDEGTGQAYREWLLGDSLGARIMRGRARAELRGKDLCCWCELGADCHADALLEVANAVEALGG